MSSLDSESICNWATSCCSLLLLLLDAGEDENEEVKAIGVGKKVALGRPFVRIVKGSLLNRLNLDQSEENLNNSLFKSNSVDNS